MYAFEGWPEPLASLEDFAHQFPGGAVVAHTFLDGYVDLYGFMDRVQAEMALGLSDTVVSAHKQEEGSSVRILDVVGALIRFGGGNKDNLDAETSV